MQVTTQRTSDYDFELPKELIAQHPLANREDARLMSVDRARDEIDHFHIRGLDELLNPHDCLVVNNTRVLTAKLVGFRKSTGGRWTGLFLDSDKHGNWNVLAKTRGKAKIGEKIALQNRNGVEALELVLISRLDNGSWIVRPETEKSPQEVLNEIGRVPLPHYIRGGNMVDADLRDYQTVYAKEAGSCEG